MLAILGGFGAALAWTVTTISASRASKLVDAWSLLATVMVVGLGISVPLAAVAGIPDGLHGSSFGWLVASGCCNVGGLLLTYSALSVGKVGVVAPITSTEGGVAAVIAVAAGESLSASTGLLLALIAAGVACASRVRELDVDARRVHLRSVLFACGAAVVFGCGLYATGRVGQSLGVAWAPLPPRVVGVLVIALPLLLMRRWRITRAALPWATAGGVCEVLGFALYAFGARHGLAVAAVLASQFAALSAVVGFLAFHEQLTRLQIAGVAAIIAGVSLLSAING